MNGYAGPHVRKIPRGLKPPVLEDHEEVTLASEEGAERQAEVPESMAEVRQE